MENSSSFLPLPSIDKEAYKVNHAACDDEVAQ
jgi:hypothetical protein